MIEDQIAARSERLLIYSDILESAQLMGERADVGVIIETVWNALQEFEPAPESPKTLTEEEERILCAIGALLKGMADMAAIWAGRLQPGRVQRKLLEYRLKLHAEILGPRLERMSESQRHDLFLKGVYWSYIVLAPEHQIGLLQIMERVAAGERPTKAQRKNAEMFLRSFKNWAPVARPKPRGLEPNAAENDG